LDSEDLTISATVTFHPAKLCQYQVLVGKEAQLENSSVSSCTALGLKGGYHHSTVLKMVFIVVHYTKNTWSYS